MSFFTPAGVLAPEPGWEVAQRWDAATATAGPWSADAMHGGPPSALLVRACEQVCATPLTALRASLDFLSPVPVGPVEVRARTIRPGRRVALAEAVLSASGRDALRATVWLLDTAGAAASSAASSVASAVADAVPREPDAAVPAPDDCPPALTFWSFPYAEALDWRRVHGDVEGPGDAACWVRPRIPLVDGEDLSGLQRAVLVADSGSGISAGLDWATWYFVNVDLTVHLSRPLDGNWLLMDATSRYEPTGTGLATSVLSDATGVVGRGAQTLLVTPR